MNNYELNFIFDDPVQYKNLSIHPPTMKDYIKFYSFAPVLLIDKNSPPLASMDTIPMSYLEYLYQPTPKESENLPYLDALLRLLIKEDSLDIRYGYDINKKVFFTINGDVYTQSDFNEIKNIIVQQNLLKLPNDLIDKRLRDAEQKAKEIKQRSGGTKMSGVEDQIVALMISTGLSLEKIKGMSIRKFSKAIERLDLKIHYQIYLSASLSGFVTFKDKSFIKHWLSDTSVNDLDGLVSYNSVASKFS